MRSERCHRILEQLIEKHGDKANGKNKDRFDAARPWDGVWRRMADKERDWWFKHVDKPIMLVEAKIKAASSFVEGDAPIAGKGHAAAEAAPSYYDPPASHRQRRGTKRRAAVALAGPPTEAPTGNGGWAGDDWSGYAARQDLSEHDGQKYTKNRGGYRLCPWYQAGNCPMGTGSGKCMSL